MLPFCRHRLGTTTYKINLPRSGFKPVCSIARFPTPSRLHFGIPPHSMLIFSMSIIHILSDTICCTSHVLYMPFFERVSAYYKNIAAPILGEHLHQICIYVSGQDPLMNGRFVLEFTHSAFGPECLLTMEPWQLLIRELYTCGGPAWMWLGDQVMMSFVIPIDPVYAHACCVYSLWTGRV